MHTPRKFAVPPSPTKSELAIILDRMPRRRQQDGTVAEETGIPAMMQAIIFDMDGVLIDSEPFWQDAEMQVFGEIGVPLSDADCASTMGLRTDEVVRYWFGRTPWTGPTVDEVSERIVDYVEGVVRRQGVALPGVAEALNAARSANLRVGLASSSPVRLIDTVCEVLQIREFFDAICSAANEARGKPHPDVYLTAATQLRLAPGSCLVIEDSLPGVQAAKAAGMIAVAIPPSHLFDAPGYDLADIKLRSMRDLELDQVASLFGTAS
jgi:sugar-phosphatase